MIVLLPHARRNRALCERLTGPDIHLLLALDAHIIGVKQEIALAVDPHILVLASKVCLGPATPVVGPYDLVLRVQTWDLVEHIQLVVEEGVGLQGAPHANGTIPAQDPNCLAGPLITPLQVLLLGRPLLVPGIVPDEVGRIKERKVDGLIRQALEELQTVSIL